MRKIPVWMMIQEAVLALGGDAIPLAEIRKYIVCHYGVVNPGTINAQANACTVNRQSRVGMPENQRPRIANEKYDFLFTVGRGLVTYYDSNKHGTWEIAKQGDALVVRRTDNGISISDPIVDISLPETPPVKRSAPKRPDVESPSSDAVRRYLKSWDELEGYHAQENALNKLFWEFCPENKRIDDVLLKAATLNAFYATNIYNVYALATHIVSLNCDERLKQGDETLVMDIASGHGVKNKKSGKEICFYSFATKYCSHHQPKAYPIYDRYVDEMLVSLRDADRFAKFNKEDLRNAMEFKRIILALQDFYGLQEFSLKEIDQYLWQYGKQIFQTQNG